jgi:hypothetical protein
MRTRSGDGSLATRGALSTPPEAGDAEERVDAVQEPGQWSRAVTPRRTVESAVIGLGQAAEVNQGEALRVSELGRCFSDTCETTPTAIASAPTR